MAAVHRQQLCGIDIEGDNIENEVVQKAYYRRPTLTNLDTVDSTKRANGPLYNFQR